MSWDPQVIVYDEATCPTGTTNEQCGAVGNEKDACYFNGLLAAAQQPNGATPSVLVSNVGVGATFFIRVGSTSGKSGKFYLTVRHNAPMASGKCSEATAIAPGFYTAARTAWNGVYPYGIEFDCSSPPSPSNPCPWAAVEGSPKPLCNGTVVPMGDFWMVIRAGDEPLDLVIDAGAIDPFSPNRDSYVELYNSCDEVVDSCFVSSTQTVQGTGGLTTLRLAPGEAKIVRSSYSSYTTTATPAPRPINDAYWTELTQFDVRVGYLNDICAGATTLSGPIVDGLEVVTGTPSSYVVPRNTREFIPPVAVTDGPRIGDTNSRCSRAMNYAVWYRYDVPSDVSRIRVSLCRAGLATFDTQLEVFDRCPAYNKWLQWTPYTQFTRSLGCNNDNANCPGTSTGSELTVSVTPGAPVFIRVGSPQDDFVGDASPTGTAYLSVFPWGTQQCLDTTELTEDSYILEEFFTLPNPTSVTPSGATFTCEDSSTFGVTYDPWFRYVVPKDGAYWVTTCGLSAGHAVTYDQCDLSATPTGCLSSPDCEHVVGNYTGYLAGTELFFHGGSGQPAEKMYLSIARKEEFTLPLPETSSTVGGFLFEYRVTQPIALLKLSVQGLSGGSQKVALWHNPKPLSEINGNRPAFDPGWELIGDVQAVEFTGSGIYVEIPLDLTALNFTQTDASPNRAGPIVGTLVLVSDGYRMLTGAYVADPAAPILTTPDFGVIAQGYEVQPTQYPEFERIEVSLRPVVAVTYDDPSFDAAVISSGTSGSSGGSDDTDNTATVIGASVAGAVLGCLVLVCLPFVICCGIPCLLIFAVVALVVVVLLILAVVVVVVVAVAAIIGVLVLGVAAVIGAGVGGTKVGVGIFRKRKEKYAVDLLEALRQDEDGADLGAVMKGAGARKGRFREIDWDDLRIKKKLGEGAFGKVYKGRWRGADVAVKTINVVNISDLDESVLEEFRSEAALMELLGNHPNVIKFVGAVTRGGHLALVTEFCANGSLYDILMKGTHTFEPLDLLVMARDIASAVSHLHSENVVHRDLAARNVLVAHDMSVRVSDFGMSRVVSKAEEKQVNTTHSNIGPVKWMAPESIQNKQYSEKSDAFSFGVLLWELYSREEPYAGMAVLDVAVGVAREGLRLDPPSAAPAEVQALMRQCWQKDPNARPSFGEISERLEALVASARPDVESSDTDSYGGQHESDASFAAPMSGGDVAYSIPTGGSSADNF